MKRQMKVQIDKLKRDICDEQLRLKKEIFDLDYEYFLVSKETLHEKLEKLDALDAKKFALEEKSKRVMKFCSEYADSEEQYCVFCFVERSRLVSLETAVSQSNSKKMTSCRQCNREPVASMNAASKKIEMEKELAGHHAPENW
jgi:hypothetical protein